MFACVRIGDWAHLKSSVSYFRGYLFRGQACASWSLKTSVERIAETTRLPFEEIPRCENVILRDFSRRAHLVMSSPPAAHEWLEWLAAIQHYGGPTRLLDFTRSIYAGAFFALEQAAEDAALWAIDEDYLHGSLTVDHAETSELRRIRYQNTAEAALKNPSHAAGLLPLEPYRFNERIAVQKGVFLFPLDVTQSFATNLSASTGVRLPVQDSESPIQSFMDFLVSYDNTQIRQRVVKLVLPHTIRREILDDLDDMNIHAAALFPGIEGVARSLHRHLRCW